MTRERTRLLALMERYCALSDLLLPCALTKADEIISTSDVLDEMDSVKREIDEILSEAAAQVREF